MSFSLQDIVLAILLPGGFIYALYAFLFGEKSKSPPPQPSPPPKPEVDCTKLKNRLESECNCSIEKNRKNPWCLTTDVLYENRWCDDKCQEKQKISKCAYHPRSDGKNKYYYCAKLW